MATIFVSCAYEDNSIGKALESRLFNKGHKSNLPIGTAMAGVWRHRVTRALAMSDTLIAILSNHGLGSRNVLGEVGAARVLEYTKGMLLLPVLVEGVPMPDFVSDVFCYRLPSSGDSDIDNLARELDKAIGDSVRLVPRIFISHRHKDEPIAAAFVALLEQTFHIDRTDIRCTSVQPYNLTPGERTSERLRTDLSGAELVIGILSPDTTESNYVLCELGASWGRDVATFPVLARGATSEDIPSPLSERHSVSLENEANCAQLVDYVAANTSLRRKDGVMGIVAQYSRKLAEAARVKANQPSN